MFLILDYVSMCSEMDFFKSHLSGPGDTNTDDDSYFIMFLIRRNGICLPDECSRVSLQGRQFGEKGSPFQLLTHQINIQLRSTFIAIESVVF